MWYCLLPCILQEMLLVYQNCLGFLKMVQPISVFVAQIEGVSDSQRAIFRFLRLDFLIFLPMLRLLLFLKPTVSATFAEQHICHLPFASVKLSTRGLAKRR